MGKLNTTEKKWEAENMQNAWTDLSVQFMVVVTTNIHKKTNMVGHKHPWKDKYGSGHKHL